MKSYIVFVTILVVLNFINANQMTGMIKAMAGKCKKQENASDSDVEKVASGQAPESKEGKCLAACLGEQFGLMKDKKLTKDGVAKKLTKAMGNDADKKKKAEEVLNVCSEVTNADRCEAAYEIWKCLQKESESRNLKLF